jgi:hypothetical protein
MTLFCDAKQVFRHAPLAPHYQGWQKLRGGLRGVKQQPSIFDLDRYTLQWGNCRAINSRAASDIEAGTVEWAMDFPGYQSAVIQWLGQVCALVAVCERHAIRPAKQNIYPADNLSRHPARGQHDHAVMVDPRHFTAPKRRLDNFHYACPRGNVAPITYATKYCCQGAISVDQKAVLDVPQEYKAQIPAL